MSKYDKVLFARDSIDPTTLVEVTIDVYDVLMAFQIACPATQHALKKLLQAGNRGHKGTIQDLQEARESVSRAIQLQEMS